MIEDEETEEIFDCIDLVQGDEYYIQLVYYEYFNNNILIELTEKYNGIYKLTEHVTHNYYFSCSRHLCYKIINKNNIQTTLMCFYTGINTGTNSYIFYIVLENMNYLCKIYKINNTEYVLK